MESTAKVVSQAHERWGIKGELRNSNLAIARLLELGTIKCPVNILYSEAREKCTAASAEDSKSAGSGKNLKAWGKVEEALRKTLEEQETREAARIRLLATPKPAVGAATQTASESDRIEGGNMRGLGAFHPFPSPSPDPPEPPGDPPEPPGDPPTFPRSPPGPSPPAEPSEKAAVSLSVSSPPAAGPAQEAEQRARCFWQGLVEKARNEAGLSDPAGIGKNSPPPCAFKNGAEPHGEGGREEAGDGNAVSPLNNACAGKRGDGAATAVECKTNQSALFKLGPYRARTSPGRRRGDHRGRERHHPQREERGRSRTKRHGAPEVYRQSASGSESSNSCSDSSEEPTKPGWDSETERAELVRFRAKPNKALNNIGRQSRHKLTDWGKIKAACGDRAPAASMHAFPGGVARAWGSQQRAYTPVNPKEAKAISEIGINSAVVPTLEDNLSSNNDLLTFDITQINCMHFHGAGRIVFKQEWQDDRVSPGFRGRAATQRAVPSRHSFPRQHPRDPRG
ncbi:uncharacterized protein LOC132085754 [Ammospiza nelsoni]|uniref:uncharacterized protein LOC132085754 n=1 Tax=Ammospiza nelsoni TaxID=2857394 RepID=UPI00286B5FF5|nr:uncharacterized protein LOC132085754 [Ammospiza nelsoni]